MKAFLLAAGEGRRLRPLTDTVPKCLVPIGGTPLLAIWLAALERGGVTDVLVNLHYAHDHVRAFLNGWRSSLRIHTAYESSLLGSAGTVLTNRDFVRGEDSFLIAYADNLTTLDLARMTAFHDSTTTALTLGVSPTDRPSQKGTVVLDQGGRVVLFEEKVPQPRSNLANAGVYLARQRTFDYFPAAMPASGVLDFGFDVLPRMAPDLTAYRIEELLIDIGTLEDYARAQDLWAAETTRVC
ncbi:MAG TPA: nucleotidyltransferase family protein [Vicinamibacterales bacterium]|jgi:mannose-1-phosphate guanylyltransferase|nr:nucleotidyltransferase family protein [Vicinamibacterales bacterium]